MRQLINYVLFAAFILTIGLLIYPENKKEIILGTLTPFAVSLTETYLLFKFSQTDIMSTTKILMIGFVLKMIFFAPFLLALIYFYAFNTHSFVFSFLGSFIAFHTLEAMFINSLFNHRQKKYK
jgi:hypothetical protein|tara:strand:+ start:135 stop:503 length:369 start_codon:yes stop_codon:yes gene_type:complete